MGLFIGPAVMTALILVWREWVGSRPGPINPVAEELEGDPAAHMPKHPMAR
ncbi:hypothetical protein GT370_14220 [Acidocella sp. MX-AZ03]|uniref:hypothetical protein n=1 Tax=Acidocella sp. MX-AZ03 TaxID=2697363 RepID=UPI0022DCFDBA|nr:hypothetical protein [Acidocella sp. MX-AZ03]WBO58353.1 hypothetical protein GT370_14220 [Acidocella sp. MX-AZ03]